MYRWSQLLIPTLREAPAEAESVSYRLLLRAGYIRQHAPGIFSSLCLAQRSLRKIASLIRREMDTFGQEFGFPLLQPRELLAQSEQLPASVEAFRILDRKNAELALAMGYEQMATEIARRDLRSYKQLPQVWYAIQNQFRDDTSFRSGLLRARQTSVLSSFSFDIDETASRASYRTHHDAFHRILERCGVRYVVAKAGETSEAFAVNSPHDEDSLVHCEKCGYLATLSSAQSKVAQVDDLPPDGDGAPLLVHTPGMKTIEDVARFLRVSPKNKIKTLAWMVTDPDSNATFRPLVVLVRGDHQLSEARLSAALGGRQFRPMVEEEIRAVFQSPAGFLGPVGLTGIASKGKRWFSEGIILLVDKALQRRTNLICGANREDHHLKNVTPDRDFTASAYLDLRTIAPDEPCINCESPLKIESAMKIAILTSLGTEYSEPMGVRILDRNGKEFVPLMGSYELALERVLIAAIEQNNDEDGFWLAPAIAPFEIVITLINTTDETLVRAAADLCSRLEQAGFEVLLDDRNERPGVKFKDADLVGIPYRINVGRKVTEGTVEVIQRSTRALHDASIAAITDYFRSLPGLGR